MGKAATGCTVSTNTNHARRSVSLLFFSCALLIKSQCRETLAHFLCLLFVCLCVWSSTCLSPLAQVSISCVFYRVHHNNLSHLVWTASLFTATQTPVTNSASVLKCKKKLDVNCNFMESCFVLLKRAVICQNTANFDMATLSSSNFVS